MHLSLSVPSFGSVVREEKDEGLSPRGGVALHPAGLSHVSHDGFANLLWQSHVSCRTILSHDLPECGAPVSGRICRNGVPYAAELAFVVGVAPANGVAHSRGPSLAVPSSTPWAAPPRPCRPHQLLRTTPRARPHPCRGPSRPRARTLLEPHARAHLCTYVYIYVEAPLSQYSYLYMRWLQLAPLVASSVYM